MADRHLDVMRKISFARNWADILEMKPEIDKLTKTEKRDAWEVILRSDFPMGVAHRARRPR